jgi:hypothetical protein
MQNPVAESKAAITARFENRETLCHPAAIAHELVDYQTHHYHLETGIGCFEGGDLLLESPGHILMFSLSEIRRNRTAAARIMITWTNVNAAAAPTGS